MALSFPTSSLVGDTYQSGSSAVYQYDGEKWKAVSTLQSTGATARRNFSGSIWTVNHNLATSYPIVDIYSGSVQVIPQSVDIITSNTLRVTFPEVVVGTAVVSTGVGGPTTASLALFAESSSVAVTATSASYAVTANTLSPQYTEVTFDSGTGNAITIDGFLQIYANFADQFYWRLASGVSNQRTLRESNYWRIGDNIPNLNPARRQVLADSTTWQPIWIDTTLNMADQGDTEMMKLVSIPNTTQTSGILQPDTRVYHIVCIVGGGYANNKVYWRRLPKENLLF